MHFHVLIKCTCCIWFKRSIIYEVTSDEIYFTSSFTVSTMVRVASTVLTSLFTIDRCPKLRHPLRNCALESLQVHESPAWTVQVHSSCLHGNRHEFTSSKAKSPPVRLLSFLATWKETLYFWPFFNLRNADITRKLDHLSELTMMPRSLSDELCRLRWWPLGLGASSKVWSTGIIEWSDR